VNAGLLAMTNSSPLQVYLSQPLRRRVFNGAMALLLIASMLPMLG